MLRAWKDARPGEAFVPRPSVQAAAPCLGPRSDCDASPPAPAATPVCKFFLNTGRCALGDACPRRHDAAADTQASLTCASPACLATPLIARRTTQAWVAARRSRRAALSAAEGNPHAVGAPAKRLRAASFAAWLVRTYGLETLRAGSLGVVDVAGGAGGVAFELHCRYGVPTTVVDPRAPHLSKRARAWLASQGIEEAAPGALPRHEAMLFEASTYARFAGASCFVGMHPDQATDGIVDAALAFGRPFAVVPCCVFPTLFAARRVGPDGRRVTTRRAKLRSAKCVCSSRRLLLTRHRSRALQGRAGGVPGGQSARRALRVAAV